MPCHNVKWAVILHAAKELPSHLIDNLPWLLALLVVRSNRRQEVPGISQSIGTQRAQFREFEPTSPDFEDISANRLIVVQTDAEAQTALDDDDLTGLNEKRSEFGLDVQGSLLGNDEKLAVRVDEGFLRHAGIRGVNVRRETFEERWVARAGDCFETGNEVDLSIFSICDVEGVPGQLGGRDVHTGVQREEVGFCVGVVGQGFLRTS